MVLGIGHAQLEALEHQSASERQTGAVRLAGFLHLRSAAEVIAGRQINLHGLLKDRRDRGLKVFSYE